MVSKKLVTHHAKIEDNCPECDGVLQVRNSQKGMFHGCSNYPSCHYSKPLHDHEEVSKKLPGSHCPLCQKELLLKKGRYGLFIACSAEPDCQYTSSLNDDTESSKQSSINCPSCKKGTLLERHSRFGKTFYSCSHYPKCKYSLNDKPVNEFCPDCHGPILLEHKTNTGIRLVCPIKSCNYRGKII